MKDIFRSVLKTSLGTISKKTIQKHNAELIVVVGWTGSGIVRELLYQLLKGSYNVRRNYSDVWWDLSVPLAILGYEDVQRNVFQWISLLLKSYLSLFVKPKHKHKMIINLDTSLEETAAFWSRYITPDIVVVLREKPKSKVLKMFRKKSGGEKTIYVYNPELYGDLEHTQVREFIYSHNKGDLKYAIRSEVLSLRYKKDEIKIKIPHQATFLREYIPAAIAVGILQGISLDDLSERVRYFEFHPKQLSNAVEHLRTFIREENEKE